MSGVDGVEAAWNELPEALSPGWIACRPWFHDEARVWEQYAFRSGERPRAGKRHDESTATGATEAECVREMSR